MTGVRIAVVGGGIAGVTSAYVLRQRLPDATIVVLEASDRLGGKLRGGDIGGITADLGAESMLNRRPEAVELVRAVGLGDKIVHPAQTSAGIWTRGAIRPMPPTVMGIPADADALATSGLLSRAGVARARVETGRGVPPTDVSVGDFVRRRLGHEVVDRLVEPLLGGVYAGHASRLSLRAAAPQIAALAADGPLLAAARAHRAETATRAAPVFAGLVGGLGQLPDVVARASGATIRLGATVRELSPGVVPGTWQLVIGPTSAPELLLADAVVLATPAAPTARLLGPVVPAASRALREIEYASMAVVTLAVSVAGEDAGLLTGSGFLVPPVDGRAIKAATYSSAKWAWIGDAAPPGVAMLRASIGRAGEEQLLQRDDNELVALAMDDLRTATGVRGPLAAADVQRWGGGLPQYAVGHLDRVAAIEAAVAGVPRLAVCGAAYHGIGIAAAVAGATAAAGALADRLAGGIDRAGH